MGATLEETLREAAELAEAQNTRAATPVAPPNPTAKAAPLPKPPPAPAGAPPEDPNRIGLKGFFKRIVVPLAAGGPAPGKESEDFVKAGMSVGAAIVRAPGQLIGGAQDTLSDALIYASHNIDPKFLRSPTGKAAMLTAAIASPAARNALGSAYLRNQGGASLADAMSFRPTLGQVGFHDLNQVATEGGAMALGMVGTPEVQAPKFAANLAKAVSPKVAQRVTQLVANSARAGVATAESTEAAPGDMAARTIHGAEGFAANLLLEPILAAVIPHGKPAVGTPEDAAQDALDRTFATQRTQEAQVQSAEKQAIEESSAATTEQSAKETAPQAEALEAGTRHTDTAPQESPKGGSADASGGGPPSPSPRESIAQDANSALAKAGVEGEVVDPASMNLTPDGRIVVSSEAKQALDEAGMGRAFTDPIAAADVPKNPVIFKEVGPDGSSRVVGMMDKYDLDQFATSARAFAEDAAKDGPEALDTLAGSHVGQWRLGNLGASYDVAAMGRALTDHLEGSARPKSDEELYAAAQRISQSVGLDAADLVRIGTEFAGKSRDIDEGMLAARMVQARLFDDLVPHTGTPWATLSPDDASIQPALDAIHNALTFAKYVEEGKTGLGRGLRAAGLPTESIPDAAAYKANFGKQAEVQPRDPRMGPGLPRTPEELQAWFDLYGVAKAADDPAVLQAFLRGQTFPLKKWLTLRNSFANFFTASIVSAPRTFARDLFGPAVVSGFNTLGRITAGGMMAVNPLMSAADRAEAWAFSWGSARAYAMAMGDSMDALKFGAMTTAKAFKKGAPGADSFLDPFGSHAGSSSGLLGGHNPIDFSAQGVPRALMQAAQDANTFGGTIPYSLANAVSKFPQAVHALHGGVNEVAQRLSYLGEVRLGAYLEASRLGYEGKQFDEFVRSSLMDATDEFGKYTDQAAFDASERTAFIRRPNENDPAIQRWAYQRRAEIVRQVPETKLLMPIFTVPANALGETLRRIPGLNMAFSQTRNELLGNAGLPAQADAFGRTLMGGSALLAGWLLARAGALTGPGPEDPHDRAVWLTTHQPYSIRLGGHWFSYAKADVVGPMLGIIAGSYDHTVYHDPDKPEGVYAAVGGLAEYFKEQAALQTLSEVLNLGAAPGASQRSFDRITGGLASGFVPNFVTQLGRETTDPFVRVNNSPWDYIKDKLPGASQTLDPVRNFLGEAVMKPQAPGFNTLPINIAPVNTFAKDPVLDEVARLYDQTGYAPGALSPAAGGQAHFDMRQVPLEDHHSLYDALMKARTTATVDGVTLRDALVELMDSAEYNEAPDGIGKSLDDEGYSERTRGGMMAKVFKRFSKQAQVDVAVASPVAARWLAAARVKTMASVPLRGTSAEDIVKNPSLLDALGIDLADYEARVRGE